MPSTISLPEQGETQSFLSDLAGQNIPTTSKDGSVDVYAVAEYADQDGTVIGLIGCDLPAAARLGAILTRIPKGAVEDTIKTREFPDHIAENLGETLNIASNLFPSHNERRICLTRMLLDGEASQYVEAANIDESVNFDVDIAGYGPGSIVIANIGE
ncbi:MAG: hypothetical protein ACE361_13050 [Aureliella sp.]